MADRIFSLFLPESLFSSSLLSFSFCLPFFSISFISFSFLPFYTSPLSFSIDLTMLAIDGMEFVI